MAAAFLRSLISIIFGVLSLFLLFGPTVFVLVFRVVVALFIVLFLLVIFGVGFLSPFVLICADDFSLIGLVYVLRLLGTLYLFILLILVTVIVVVKVIVAVLREGLGRLDEVEFLIAHNRNTGEGLDFEMIRADLLLGELEAQGAPG